MDIEKSFNLVEGLTNEILRVEEIHRIYAEIPAGNFAAALMKHSIETARAALGNGDIAQIISSYNDLKGYKL